MVPFLALTLLTFVRVLVMHVLLPLYDVISDLVVAYHYQKEEELYYISVLIVFFVLLPHLIQSTFLVFEIIANVGAFDDYPKFIVDFYQSNPTPFPLLNLVFKILTLPLFAVFHFFLFFINMFAYAVRAVFRVRSNAEKIHSDTVGQRHPRELRAENVKDDNWSKTVVIELLFETIPQMVVQLAAFGALVDSNDSIRSFPVISSMVVSFLNFAHKCWILRGFMKVAEMTVFNTFRIISSSALDFFPIFDLYKDTAEFVLVQFFDNPMLLELWGPFKSIVSHNRTLKALTMYLEDVRDWLKMSVQLLDSLSENEDASLETLDVCVEAPNTEEAQKVGQHIEVFKQKFYDLLEKKRAKRVFFLIDAAVDVGIVPGSIEKAKGDSVEVDGYKWSWKWPEGKTARIEYCIEPIT